MKGRRIVVTGASKGFGQALCKALHARGADLLLAARPSTDLDSTYSALSKSAAPGQVVEAAAIDVSDTDAGERLFGGQWASSDVLINAAAIQGPIGLLWQNDIEAWRRTIEVDLIAPVLLSRAAIPGMIAKGSGVIVNISGGGAAAARPGFSAYAGAKAALVRVTECLAAEAAPYGIAITAIAPGAMPTAMLKDVLEAGEVQAGSQEYALAKRALDAGKDVMEPALALCGYLAQTPRMHLSGKLVSAQWDPWHRLEAHAGELAGDIFTLRRIVPKDRGKDWGER